MVKILQKESLVLRQKAEEVPRSEIKTPRIKKILDKMIKALDEQDDGVAIAAPQIGENLQIFVMSKRVYEMMNKKILKEKDVRDEVFINPKITKISKEKEMVDEGCLSVRWLYGKVNRSKKATIEAYDADGKKFIMGGSGIIAQIFQHEMDHLRGILFIDKAEDLEELPPQKPAPKI